MTAPDGDNELDEFIARRSALHRRLASRDGTEPPPELDRAVLSRAREAIKAHADTPVYRAPTWALPVGLAATILLTFAVVLSMARTQHSTPVAATMAMNEKVQPVTAPSASQTPALSPMTPPLDAALAKKAVSSPPIEVDVRGSARTKTDSALLAANSVSPRLERQDLQHDAPPPQSADSAAGAATSLAEVVSTEAEPTLADRGPPAVTAAPDEPVVTAAARAQARTSALVAAAAVSTPARHPDSQTWLRQIEQLRAEGRIAEANHQLEEFRRAFPTQPASAAASTRPPTK